MSKYKISLRELVLCLYIILNIICMKVYYYNSIVTIMFFLYLLLSIKDIIIKKSHLFIIIAIGFFFFIPAIYYNQLGNGIKMAMKILTILSPILILLIETNRINDLHVNSSNNMYIKLSKFRILFIILFSYIFIINIYYLNGNPYFARNMANYNYNVPGVSGFGLFSGGGYYIIYALLFMGVYSLNQYCRARKPYLKVASMINFILIGILIYKSNFATAFILYLLSIIIFIIIKNKAKFRILNILIYLIAIVMAFNYNTIAHEIVNMIPNDTIIYMRLNDAINENESSTLDERIDLMSKSIGTIKKNFLIGVSHKYGYNYNLMSSSIGLHTEWIDVVAKYGIVIFGVYLYFLYVGFKRLKLLFKGSNNFPVIITCLILLIILGFLNPVSNTGSYFIIFQVIPILMVAQERKYTNDENLETIL